MMEKTEMSEWRPIETAKKVIGDYLVYQPEHKAGRNILPARICMMSHAGYSREITHWMPLPSPPSQTTNNDNGEE